MDRFHFWYSIGGVLLGGLFLASGVFCTTTGRRGRATMSVEIFGTKVEIATSVPGIIFAVLGFLIVLATRLGA